MLSHLTFQHDFTAMSDVLKQVDPRTIGLVHDSVNRFRRMPIVDEPVGMVLVKKVSMFESAGYFFFQGFRIHVDHFGGTVYLEHPDFTIEMRIEMDKYQYCWAVIVNNDNRIIDQVKREYLCNDRNDLVLRTLAGQHALLNAEATLDFMYLVGKSLNGLVYEHSYSVTKYTVRKWWHNTFNKRSKVMLK